MEESLPQREFDELIAAYAEATSPDEQKRINGSIWDRFGTTGTAFISDMASFTLTSRVFGVTHFLKLIHRTRKAIGPIIADNSGVLLKCDADNCYGFFAKVDDAVQASLDINAELFRANQQRPTDDHIFLSIGIDYGELLLIGSEDFYGDPVNTASKLGEDLAGSGETLITERAIGESQVPVPESAEQLVARISDVEIRYLRLPTAEPTEG
jgi:class 3 adenylate cyclase